MDELVLSFGKTQGFSQCRLSCSSRVKGEVVPAEFADPVPQRIPVGLQLPPHGWHVVDGVGDDHLAAATGVLVDAVQLAPEIVPPAGVVRDDGLDLSAKKSLSNFSWPISWYRRAIRSASFLGLWSLPLPKTPEAPSVMVFL